MIHRHLYFVKSRPYPLYFCDQFNDKNISFIIFKLHTPFSKEIGCNACTQINEVLRDAFDANYFNVT